MCSKVFFQNVNVLHLYRIWEIHKKNKSEERKDSTSCLHSSMSLRVTNIHSCLLHDYSVMLIRTPNFWDTGSANTEILSILPELKPTEGGSFYGSCHTAHCTHKILCTPKVKYLGSNTTTVIVHNLASSIVITNASASHTAVMIKKSSLEMNKGDIRWRFSTRQ